MYTSLLYQVTLVRSLRTGPLPVEGGVGTDDGVGTSSPDPLPTSWCVKKYQVAALC